MPADLPSEGAEALRRGTLRARTLLAAMAAIGAAAALVSMLVLYRAAVSKQEDRLRELVGSQAELIDAAARLDPVQSQGLGSAALASLRRVADRTARWQEHASDVSLLILGRSGENVVVHVENNRLLAPESPVVSNDFPVSLAERVLSVPSGAAEYATPDGKNWLVAHERLPALDMAVLARLDLDVLRRPLWHALWVSGLGSLIMVALGITLLRKTSVGLVEELARALTRRVAAEAELQAHRDHLARTIEQRTEELRRAQKELLLRERLATLGQITAKVSHELRNPLATLRASLFTLRERTKGQENGLERIIDRAVRNVARCDRIIEELLSYTRPGTPRRDTFSLSELLEEVLSEYQPAAPLALEREIEAGVELLADREDVRRMLINLLNNAVEAASERELSGGSVRLVLQRERAQIVIRVEDSGPGMAEDVLSRAFEPLFSTKSFGVGLGLPIVRELAERNGASVLLTSRTGEGTRAELKFPAAGVDP